VTGFGVDRGAGSTSGNPISSIFEALIDAKGDLVAGTADNVVARLAVGANESQLVADSAQTTGLKWVAPTVDYVIAAKGDLRVGTAADTVAALTVGANEKRLVAASAEATGLKYVADTVNYAIETAGDILVGTAADTVARKAVGTAGTVLMSRAAETDKLAYVAALNKGIYGLTYDNGTDATNDININTGGAMDTSGAYWMTVTTALGKQSDVAWAVGGTTGAPQGGLDLIGSAGNNDFYIWLIARSDTGVVDALFSLSSSAPTMPANYEFKRLIGWFKRVGGTVVGFSVYETEGGGIELLWNAPTLDVNLANTLTTSRRTDAVKVPLNFSVIAHLNAVLIDAGAIAAWVCCPDQADAAPSTTVAPLTNLYQGTAGAAVGMQLSIRTSAAGLIASRANGATADNYAVTTMGFTWARRN
jgi:hypothetical protein